MDLVITQDDIEKAREAYQSPDYIAYKDCPACQSLKRRFGAEKKVRVGATMLRVGTERYLISTNLRDFNTYWDLQQPVTPGRFRLMSAA